VLVLHISVKYFNNLHGGLKKLAELLDVQRIGPAQAELYAM
jgi:hypothetical protein